MSRSPHPLALFSLCPREGDERAIRAVSHLDNRHHVSVLPDGREVLDVGFHIRGKSSTTLATIGRGVDADIYVEGSAISKIQCSFEIDLDTGVVMLYDRSHGCTTQVFGENSTPFEHGRIRRILVQQHLNTIVGMGGERGDLILFELEWHRDPTQTARYIKDYNTIPCGRVENPRLARTLDAAPTDFPSRRETRAHTPRQLEMRYLPVGPPLGSGQFGTVYKAIDVDSGKLMAVKIVERPERLSQQEAWRKALKREVEILCSISHPHIINYITSQGWGEQQLKIFTGLMKGTLEDLVQNGADTSVVADSVCNQMLQALDHTAWNGIIHRDVKPENILFEPLPSGGHQFRLTDFGLSNHAVDATTFAGSILYMAPEMFRGTGQTSKVDIWSLFVTIWWTLDRDFRKRDFKSERDVWRAIESAASKDEMSKVREMAIVDPEQRASAAQMLVKCYNGDGLSTPRNRVPALASDAPPKIAATSALPPAPPSSTSLAPRLRRRTLQRHTNIFAAAAPYRVEKARGQAHPFRRPPDTRPNRQTED